MHECLLTARGDLMVATSMLEEIGANQFGQEYVRRCAETAAEDGMDVELARRIAHEKRLAMFRRFPLKQGEEIEELFLRHNQDYDAVLEGLTRAQLTTLGWLGAKTPENITRDVLLHSAWAELEDIKRALAGGSVFCCSHDACLRCNAPFSMIGLQSLMATPVELSWNSSLVWRWSLMRSKRPRRRGCEWSSLAVRNLPSMCTASQLPWYEMCRPAKVCRNADRRVRRALGPRSLEPWHVRPS